MATLIPAGRLVMSIDCDGVMKRLGDDRALFQEFIGFYDEDCPRLMGQLADAVNSGDAEAMHLAAHSLKGLVASIGATEVVDQAATLERMSRAGDLNEAEVTLAKLQAEVQQLCSDLAPYRKRDSSGSAKR